MSGHACPMFVRVRVRGFWTCPCPNKSFVQVRVRVRVRSSKKSQKVCFGHGLEHELMSELVSASVHLCLEAAKQLSLTVKP